MPGKEGACRGILLNVGNNYPIAVGAAAHTHVIVGISSGSFEGNLYGNDNVIVFLQVFVLKNGQSHKTWKIGVSCREYHLSLVGGDVVAWVVVSAVVLEPLRDDQPIIQDRAITGRRILHVPKLLELCMYVCKAVSIWKEKRVIQ